MNIKSEWFDLITRSRNLFAAVLLLLITAAMLLVAVGQLFCAVWITAFTSWRRIVDQCAVRIRAPKEVPDAA